MLKPCARCKKKRPTSAIYRSGKLNLELCWECDEKMQTWAKFNQPGTLPTRIPPAKAEVNA